MAVSGILITNGGVHPADKWAAHTAAQIADLIQVDEASESPEAGAARRAKPRFELDLADALESHHRGIQESERAALVSGGAERLDAPLAVKTDDLDEAVSAVEEAAEGTPFEAHFTDPQVQDVVRQIVGTHFATVMSIERSWHADRS